MGLALSSLRITPQRRAGTPREAMQSILRGKGQDAQPLGEVSISSPSLDFIHKYLFPLDGVGGIVPTPSHYSPELLKVVIVGKNRGKENYRAPIQL